MVMVVRMRSTSSHSSNRRSHHKLSERSFAICDNCGAKKLKHVACSVCGKYKNREVVDIIGRTARKEAKRKEKEKQASQ